MSCFDRLENLWMGKMNAAEATYVFAPDKAHDVAFGEAYRPRFNLANAQLGSL